MAENEKKTGLDTAKETKPTKAEKAKSDKPSIWTRLGTWLKAVKSECKKISWASWKSVQSNSIIVIVCVIILSAVIGILDYCFSGAIVGLSRLI